MTIKILSVLLVLTGAAFLLFSFLPAIAILKNMFRLKLFKRNRFMAFTIYRSVLGIDMALNEIGKNSGILYDKNVADACIRIFRERGFQLEKR